MTTSGTEMMKTVKITFEKRIKIDLNCDCYVDSIAMTFLNNQCPADHDLLNIAGLIKDN